MVRAATIEILESFLIRRRNRVIETTGRVFKNRFKKMWDTQKKRFLAGLSQFQNRFPLEESLRESITEPEWANLFDQVASESRPLVEPGEEEIKAAYTRGVNDAIKDLNVGDIVTGFNVETNPRAVAFVNSFGGEKITKINRHTKDQIRTIISTAIKEGWSWTRLSNTIDRKFDGFSGRLPQKRFRKRSDLVAVTELGQAYMEGQEQIGLELLASGIPMEKSWLTVGDLRVTELCQTNEQEGWINLEAVFPSGHSRPLRFPGCRCTLLQRRKRV